MKKRVDLQTILTAIIIFFISRAFLPGGIIPFGFAAFAAAAIIYQFELIPSLIFAAGALAGLATLKQGWQVLVVFLSILFFWGFVRITELLSKSRFKQSLALLLCHSVAILIVVCIQGFILMDVFKGLIQCAISLISFLIFISVVSSFSDDISRKIMTNEEMACIAISVSIAVMGFPDLVLFTLSIRRLIVIVLIMVFSYRGGLGTGAATGVTAGILMAATTSISQMAATLISLYAFCGFLAGLLNKVGKIGVALGFFLGNILLTAMLFQTADIIINLFEVGFGIFIFIILPEKLTAFLKLPQLAGVRIPTVKINYAEKLRDTAVKKIKGFSEIFGEMSRTCDELSDNDINSGKEEVLQIMDKIADKVCSGCAMINFCWESSFYETYQSVMGLITSLEGRGRILPDEIPKYLIKNCCRINNLLPEAKSAFDMWKIESLWRKRLQESRQMLPSQLDGMSGILESLADEVNLSVSFVESMEKNILKVMNNKEIRVKNTTVCRNRYGRYEVSLEAKCCSGKRNCVTCYSEAVSEALGVKMSCDDNTCVNPAGNPWCSLTFSEEESFKTATGIASAKAFGSAVTGDSHSFFDVNRGIHMAALSDGMGTGEKASKQSKNVIKLLELFMESGLEKYSAVSMINSLLFTGTEKELSATIDLALFDLYEGRVSFLKFGAVPAVIKRNNRVETVVISSLPVGLVRTSSNYKTIDRKLENGDFVILMTDGIDEAYRRAGKSDLDLFAYIENFDSRNPQDMADKIIAKAMALSGNQPTDDMMVLVTKVWKSA